MGCDIHIYVEQRVNGVWEQVSDDIDNGRNYDLFSILADVRNGRGFAGVDTGDGYVPISEPKGMPEDVSKGLIENVCWDYDHSHSYLSLRELIEYDWTQVTTKRFQISAAGYYRWYTDYFGRRKGNMPNSFSGAVLGRNVTHISEGDMERLMPKLKELWPNPNYDPKPENAEELDSILKHKVVMAKFEQAYFKRCSGWWSESMPLLCSYVPEGGSIDDVRIVFWFDN